MPLGRKLWVTATEVSGVATCPRHLEQPHPLTRLLITACHSWPFKHRHHTFRLLPGRTLSGDKSPFFKGVPLRSQRWIQHAKRCCRSDDQSGTWGNHDLASACLHSQATHVKNQWGTPPYFTMTSWPYLIRRQVVILGRMPLRGEIGGSTAREVSGVATRPEHFGQPLPFTRQ